MEVIREFIDASSLMTVMALPEAFQNRKLEVIVLPVEDPGPVQKNADIMGTIQSLVGAVPYTDQSLEALRAERLEKYEATD